MSTNWLASILADQCGLVTRDQLRGCGVSRGIERGHLDAARWRALNDRVVCTHNGPLTARQAEWAALLSVKGQIALCGLTALQRHGVVGFACSSVHVVVLRGCRVLPVPGIDVVVHESRRFSPADVLPRLPPVTSIERAAIDAAAWSADVKTATRLVTAPIQQRLTTATRLREALTDAGQVKFSKILFPFIADLEGGAEALSEVAFFRWCQRHRLPKPETRVRLDYAGRRRYLDATFRTTDGETLLVEIDGGIHLTLTTRWEDTAKDNDAVIASLKTLRFPSIAIYTDDPRALRQLRDALGLVRR